MQKMDGVTFIEWESNCMLDDQVIGINAMMKKNSQSLDEDDCEQELAMVRLVTWLTQIPSHATGYYSNASHDPLSSLLFSLLTNIRPAERQENVLSLLLLHLLPPPKTLLGAGFTPTANFDTCTLILLARTASASGSRKKLGVRGKSGWRSSRRRKQEKEQE